MTNPRYALARLNAKTASLDSLPGGIASLTPEDVAAACAGLPRAAYLLALAKYVDDWSVLNELERLVWLEVVDMANKATPHWPGGKERLRRLGWMAVAENISPCLCPRCNGRTVLYKKHGLAVDCDLCNGTGMGVPNESEMALEMKMTTEEWRRDWEPRYQIVFQRISDWLMVANDHIKKQLEDVAIVG